MTTPTRTACLVGAALLIAALSAQSARASGCHPPDKAQIGLDFSTPANLLGAGHHESESAVPSEDPSSQWHRMPCEPDHPLPPSSSSAPSPSSGSALLGIMNRADNSPSDWLIILSARKSVRDFADTLERPPRLRDSMTKIKSAQTTFDGLVG